MALSVTSRSPREPRSLEPQTRLTMTFRELSIEGKKSWHHCWIFVRHAADSGDEEMKKVIEAFDGLKKREKLTATPEFVCDLASVDPTDMAAEVFREYLSYSSDAANLVAAAGLPDVVRKSVQVAKTIDGHRDRKMQFEHSGFLPTKQGGGIHVNATANADIKSAMVIQAPELGTMENDTIRFTRLLKDSSSTPSGTHELAPSGVPALGGRE